MDVGLCFVTGVTMFQKLFPNNESMIERVIRVLAGVAGGKPRALGSELLLDIVGRQERRVPRRLRGRRPLRKVDDVNVVGQLLPELLGSGPLSVRGAATSCLA